MGHELFNVHLIACPMYELHTSDNIFYLTTKIPIVLCPNWKDKVIGVTTDMGIQYGRLPCWNGYTDSMSGKIQFFITFGVLLINWI